MLPDALYRLGRFCRIIGWRPRNRRNADLHIAAEVGRVCAGHKDDAIDGRVRGNSELEDRIAILQRAACCLGNRDEFRLAHRNAGYGKPFHAIRRDRSGNLEMQKTEVRFRQMENGAAAQSLFGQIEDGECAKPRSRAPDCVWLPETVTVARKSCPSTLVAVRCIAGRHLGIEDRLVAALAKIEQRNRLVGRDNGNVGAHHIRRFRGPW